MAAAGAELLFPLTELAVMGFGAGRPASSDLLPPRRHGRATTSAPTARRGRADRLPRLSLRTREASRRPPASRSTTSCRRRSGRGGAAGCEKCASVHRRAHRAARSRTTGTASRREHALHRPSVLRRTRGQQLDPAFLADRAGEGRRRSSGSCPARATRKSRRTSRRCSPRPRRSRAARPDVRFLVAAFNERQAATVRAPRPRGRLPVEVHVGRTPEIIELADACISVSGSVSLE